jgi:hypothetical protein
MCFTTCGSVRMIRKASPPCRIECPAVTQRWPWIRLRQVSVRRRADAAYAAAEDARRAGVAVKAAAQADAENTAQALADASRASGSEEPSRLSFRRPPDPGVGLLGQVTEQPLHSADSARNSSALAAEGERWVRGDCRCDFPV